MGVSDPSEEVVNNTKANSFLRIGEVINKSPEGVVVDLSFKNVDIKVVSINNR